MRRINDCQFRASAAYLNHPTEQHNFQIATAPWLWFNGTRVGSRNLHYGKPFPRQDSYRYNCTPRSCRGFDMADIHFHVWHTSGTPTGSSGPWSGARNTMKSVAPPIAPWNGTLGNLTASFCKQRTSKSGQHSRRNGVAPVTKWAAPASNTQANLAAQNGRQVRLRVPTLASSARIASSSTVL